MPMEHPSIPLQRSFALSLGVHVLLFGTALAFAHYGEVLFGGGSRIITVDLVGEGGETGRGSGPLLRTGPAEVRVPEERHLPAAESLNREAAAPVAPLDVPGNGREPGGAGPSAETSPSIVAGDGVGSGGPAGPAGPLSSDQWQMLRSAIEKVKIYPRLARERGIEGVVLIRFRVLPSGAVDKVAIVKSSGASILDEASVKTVHSAGPMPYVDGWIEVPMVYELQ